MSFLYDLIILPLVFIYELIFSICCNYLVGHFGFIKDYLLVGIIIVSLFVNILSLPLYNAADKLQKNERAKQKSMQKVVNHINHVFNGDEKFLILNSYYRLENYNPIYQLKTAIPLLLQIPFFTAAYIFFTNTKIFTGESLYCLPLLKDLSKPDMLLNLFGYNINVLPIVMTAINLISSFIYTKDLNFKDKLQPLLLALIFLVLLYNSPSALVIYWILNNIFSLIKIFVISVLEKIKKVDTAECMDAVNTKNSNRLAIVSLLTIFILLAIFIPSNIIASSPTEFTISTPVNILKFTVTVFAGYFFWELLYYQMLSDRIKVIGASFIFAVSIYLLLNHIVFLNNVGILTENLIYTEGFTRFSISDVKKDICIVFFALVLFIVSTKFTKISSIISTLLLLSIFAVFIMNFYKIGNLTLSIANNTVTTQRNNEGITFSKNGRNVIVIMLDRSCGAYFSFVLSNKPQLLNVYDGFTFYKNTLSCSGGTLLGATPIFGGYDYLPQNSNKRKNTLLVDKHNEALTIMPYNFSNNGYNCTVANLPNENYG
ncbi:MAG: YidC/Oxa1 family membrane protein insertase, partial [Lachnospiraceae bacterium]|nr:YidC/Oxa1 family membrane protein insertase [Lachnospiraceae bacterium]